MFKWTHPDGSKSTEPLPRAVKLAPPQPKRIRPTAALKPLAAKLLAVGMARTMAGR